MRAMPTDNSPLRAPRSVLGPALVTALALLAGCSPAAPDAASPTTPTATASATPAAPPALPSAAPSVSASASASAAPAAPQPKAPVLKAIDVYGTDRFDAAWVKTRFGDKIQRYFDTEDDEEGNRIEKEVAAAIIADKKEIGWVKLSPVVYYDKGDTPEGFITVDVVEAKDMKTRLTFGPEPKGDVDDPGGLVASWKEYESTYFRMLREQKISPQRVACPAFHCMGGYEHEALKPYGEKFSKGVPENQDKLVRVLKEDKDPKDRAAAAFLLAHMKDGKKLTELMLGALKDPSSLVRNNATRVLVNVAMFHPEVAIPLKPFLPALDGPTMSDRNKAVAVLSGLLERADGAALHPEVIRDGGPALLKLLRLEQPNNHDFAYKILKKLSGKDFGERDYAAWQKWLDEQRAAKGAAGKK